MRLYETLSKMDLGTLPMYGGRLNIEISINELLHSAVRYRIDNVAQYYWQHERINWDLSDDRHFPSLAPPHPVTWLEYKMPTRYVLEDGPIHRPDFANRYAGCLINTIDRRDGPEFFNNPSRAGLADNTRWLLQCLITISDKNKPLWWYGEGCLIAVAEDGSIGMDKDGKPFFQVMVRPQHKHSRQHQESLRLAVKPNLLTFSFLAAKNVIIIDHDPRPVRLSSRRSPAKKQNKSGRAYTKHRTLEIAPLRDVLRVRNQKTATETGRRLTSISITRGHFRTYTEKAPLFGKYPGTFWVPSYVRGHGAENNRDREVKI